MHKNIQIINDIGGICTNLKNYKDEYGCDLTMERGEVLSMPSWHTFLFKSYYKKDLKKK